MFHSETIDSPFLIRNPLARPNKKFLTLPALPHDILQLMQQSVENTGPPATGLRRWGGNPRPRSPPPALPICWRRWPRLNQPRPTAIPPGTMMPLKTMSRPSATSVPCAPTRATALAIPATIRSSSLSMQDKLIAMKPPSPRPRLQPRWLNPGPQTIPPQRWNAI